MIDERTRPAASVVAVTKPLTRSNGKAGFSIMEGKAEKQQERRKQKGEPKVAHSPKAAQPGSCVSRISYLAFSGCKLERLGQKMVLSHLVLAL